MELIWKKSGSTVCVRDIYAGLSRGRSIAYTTVMTTMMRLAEKGLLKVVDHVGLANYYSPVCSRKEFISKAVFIVLQSFAKDFPEVTATGLKNIKFPARTHRKY